ncbi:MAG: DUF1659 domain-containing protein [Dethiobacter sp.]|nr:DUF1659 domain-containing protein [Dethiobacter sp.]
MSVILAKGFTRCQVRLQSGVDEQGNPVYVNRMFGRIRPETSHQDVYDVVQALLSLQSLPVSYLRRLDDGELLRQ